MRSFVAVGLPGSGKSSVIKVLAEDMGLPVISTDTFFRAARADVTHPVTRQFISDFETRYGEPMDLAALSSSGEFMARHGEQPFYDFEEAVILDLFKSGKLDNAIVDLGGTAFLSDRVRETLKEKDIVSVHLEAPLEMITDNLMKDYEETKKSGVIKRGTYFTPAKEAEDDGYSPRAVLHQLSEKWREAFGPHYRKADAQVAVEKGDSIPAVAQKVKKALFDIEMQRNPNQSFETGSVVRQLFSQRVNPSATRLQPLADFLDNTARVIGRRIAP